MELDNKDKKVLFLFSENPSMCQQELAGKVGVTQPAVCLRLKKLKEKGLIEEGHGMNLKVLGLKLAVAEGKGKLSELEKNPYFVTGFQLDENRVSVVFCGENRATADAVAKTMMKNVKVHAVDEFEGNLGFRLKKRGKCGKKCSECGFYGDCLGLPGTSWYKGRLWAGR